MAVQKVANATGCYLTFLGRLPEEELRYVVEQCDIGIVSYHRADLNNEYCASGKVFEYLEAGKPIVTTANQPLALEFCAKTGVGVAYDGFADGIRKVHKSLDSFRESVQRWVAGGWPRSASRRTRRTIAASPRLGRHLRRWRSRGAHPAPIRILYWDLGLC